MMGATPAQQSRTKSAAQSNAKPADLSTITVNGVIDIDPAKAFGSKDGVLVIEIFSDFQCPTCKQLFETTLARVMETYVTGATPCKIYVVHRDFPLPYHAYSRIAASYARAAAHVGKCQEVEAALFQNQAKWEANGDVKDTVAAVLTPGEMKKVQALVDAKTLEPLIDRDKQLGINLPVRTTPTMVFHTRGGKSYPVAGMVSYDVLKNFLDQLIRQSTSS
jgi:protein-disulfide isomerase